MSRVGGAGFPGSRSLRAAVERAALAVRGGEAGPRSGLKLRPPGGPGRATYSTNVAMLLARHGRRPREIAERVGEALTRLLGDSLAGYEVAGPGFLNLTMSDNWHREALRVVLEAGERFGAGGAGEASRVLVEFVSANPTGPLVAASGRHAAYGDALSRILAHHGHQVSREYYFNDAGSQIRLLGESVQARARGDVIPENGYQGEYVAELAGQIDGVDAMSVPEASGAAVALLLRADQGHARALRGSLRPVLLRTSASRGHAQLSGPRAGAGGAGRALLRVRGRAVAAHDRFGDDKDRVLRRSDGAPTYFAADLAYLLESPNGADHQLWPSGQIITAMSRE